MKLFRRKKKRPVTIIGKVTSITETDAGLMVQYDLNSEFVTQVKYAREEKKKFWRNR